MSNYEARDNVDANYEGDLPDADVWITKAILLGGGITQHFEALSTREWRYTVSKTSPLCIASADWAGRACKLFVEKMEEIDEHS